MLTVEPWAPVSQAPGGGALFSSASAPTPFLVTTAITPQSGVRSGRGDCPHGLWAYRESGSRTFLPCRRRTCSSDWCHRAWARGHVERITRHLSSVGLGSGVRFFTITAPGWVADVDGWNGSCARRAGDLLADLRVLMPGLEYVRVLEFQSRGLLHVHVICTGWTFVDFSRVRVLLGLYEFGPWFQSEPVRDLGAVAGYVASQYLSKSRAWVGFHARVIQYSRGWACPYWATDAGADDLTWRRARSLADPVVLVRGRGQSWSAVLFGQEHGHGRRPCESQSVGDRLGAISDAYFASHPRAGP